MTRAGRVGPALAGLLLASAAMAQPTAAPPQRGPILPPVTALPAPGTYSNTTGIQLRAADGAAIRYTLDGSEPTAQSPLLQPGQQLFVSGVYDGNRGLTTGYTIRAIATAAGHKDSEPATFAYTVARRYRTAYQSEEVSPGVRMIRDSDNDKMFLTCGTVRCALIDTGMGRGALRAYVEGYTRGLPLVVIFTHSHGDHIGQADQFIAGSTEYVGAADRPLTATFLAEHGIAAPLIARNLQPLDDGARVDLGGRALEIVSVPGHTPGSIAILDPSTGNLFTGDTFGNNSPLPPDVMWMQWVDRPLDVYLANFHAARRVLAGRVKRIFTGHNDHPLEGTAFLDHLERAVQDGLDRGEAALIPSWRPTGGWQLVNGDRFTDPNWFGMNVNRAAFSPGPPAHVARLSDLAVTNARLEPRFDPDWHDYRLVRQGMGAVTIAATPTETKSRGMTLDGKPLRPGQALPIGAAATIAVTAPDGTTTATYRVRTAG